MNLRQILEKRIVELELAIKLRHANSVWLVKKTLELNKEMLRRLLDKQR